MLPPQLNATTWEPSMTINRTPHLDPNSTASTPPVTDPPPSSTAAITSSNMRSTAPPGASPASRPDQDQPVAANIEKNVEKNAERNTVDNTAAPAAGVSLIGRAVGAAIHAGHAHPRGSYERRHRDWPRWARRRTAAGRLALTLGLPVELVTVDDDPDRAYGRNDTEEPIAGDLFTAYEPATTTQWRFISDWWAANGESWLLLGACPHCPATAVPIAQIASLADLGAHYLQPPNTPLPPALHGDPAHHPECPTRTRQT